MTAISKFDTTPAPTQLNVPKAVALLTTAMTNTKNRDGTEAVGTSMALVYEADPAGAGGPLPKFRARFGSTTGAAASGTTSKTVIRLWLNNGIVNTTAANNVLIGEVQCNAQGMSETDVVTQPADFDFKGLVVPAGWRVYAGLATAIGGTNCALHCSMVGGGEFK